MKNAQAQLCTAYIIDTYKSGQNGTYTPGAITFLGRKKIETIQWKKSFQSQEDADAFVREHFIPLGIPEARNEGEVPAKNPQRGF